MAKNVRAYNIAKRRKELSRQKKQEEKRQRRFNKKISDQQHIEMTDSKDKDKEQ